MNEGHAKSFALAHQDEVTNGVTIGSKAKELTLHLHFPKVNLKVRLNFNTLYEKLFQCIDVGLFIDTLSARRFFRFESIRESYK